MRLAEVPEASGTGPVPGGPDAAPDSAPPSPRVARPFAAAGIAIAMVALARVAGGYVWIWGAMSKNPSNDWGWFPGWVAKEAQYNPFPAYRWFAANVILPYIDFWGWVQFLVEVALAVSLTLGLLAGFGSLGATLWALNIAVGSYRIPLAFEGTPDALYEPTYAGPLLVALPLLLWAARAGRHYGVDAILRPKLLASPNPWLWRIANWGT